MGGRQVQKQVAREKGGLFGAASLLFSDKVDIENKTRRTRS
jgi:hypothetical protein